MKVKTTKTSNVPSDALASIQGIAEGLLAELEPAMASRGRIEKEDIIDNVRNSYGNALWEIYMRDFQQGDRQVLDRLLLRAIYEFEVDDDRQSLTIEDLQVTTLPRDAGIYQVLPYGKNGAFAGRPFIKTTAAQAYLPPSPLTPEGRYYAVGTTIHFPDEMSAEVAGFHIVFYGLTTTSDLQFIPRDIAKVVRDKVWEIYFPSKQIPSDNTDNENPDQ